MVFGFAPRKAEPSLEVKILGAGLAGSAADILTFPLDTAKVRLQLQGGGCSKKYKYRGLVGTMSTVVREEGALGLYNGIVPGLQRQFAFSCIRIGLYDTVKGVYSNLLDAKTHGFSYVCSRILAGATSGAIAVSIAQPTDVVKVRMQASAAAGVAGRPASCLAVYRQIYQSEGLVAGLWKGTLPNIARNSIVTAAELVSYDTFKETLLRRTRLGDTLQCHSLAAFSAGFVTTVVASPVDVVKTRFMSAGKGVYSGVGNCAASVWREGGAKAFYKGFVPSFIRISSWNVCMFVFYEQAKRALAQLEEDVTFVQPAYATTKR